MRRLGGFVFFGLLIVAAGAAKTNAQEALWPAKTHYRYQQVGGHKLFYREAGESNKPTILLLHGYPSSSHTYRELIPLLSGRYHVIAPDNLGSGYSDKPDPDSTDYTFDLLADKVHGLLQALDIKEYIIYMQDFGAPVGYRVMMRDPAKVKAIIAQNANAYLEGVSQVRQDFFNQAQLDRSPAGVAKVRANTSAEAIQNLQYLRDVKGREEIMSPDSWTHDSHFMETDKQRQIQVELFQDYKTNLDSYPKWQQFLRKHQFPTLLVWGKHDPVFTAAGAKAYFKDLPNAELHLLDAGHFAAEEQPVEIAKHMVNFIELLK
jgi:pimeloyl-ACP methyl ester carboxylesterase